MPPSRRYAAGRAWAWVVFDAALIFYVSSLQPGPGPAAGWFRFLELHHFDKLIHMLEYGVFGWLVARALDKSRDFRAASLVSLSVAFGLLYAASDEWHQSFVPGRDPSVYDWMADAAGVAAGTWIWTKRKVTHARH